MSCSTDLQANKLWQNPIYSKKCTCILIYHVFYDWHLNLSRLLWVFNSFVEVLPTTLEFIWRAFSATRRQYSTLSMGSMVTSFLTWETCSCLTTKNVSTENESKRWKRKQRWEWRNESAKKQELTESTWVKNEKMDITSHTKCRMVLENSLGKGLRTQPVLSLILVVIRSQKSSPLPLPWSDRWIFARAIYTFNGFLEVWVSKQY